MKVKLVAAVIIVLVSLLAWLYFSQSETASEPVVTAPDQALLSSEQPVNSPKENSPNKPDLDVDTTSESKQFTFKSYLDSVPVAYREQYKSLNEKLFDILNFQTEEEYRLLLSQGFPEPLDFECVDEYTSQQIANMVFLYDGDDFPECSEAKLSSIKLLNAIRAQQEFEEIVRTYVPDYDTSKIDFNDIVWPNGDKPSQVNEAYNVLINSRVAVRHGRETYIGVGILGKAYSTLQTHGVNSPHRTPHVVTYFAAAQKLLNSSKIHEYVQRNMSEYVDEFNEQVTNELNIVP